MRFTDDFTPTEEAAEAFESARSWRPTRLELAEEAGYDAADDTLTAGRSTTPRADFPPDLLRASALAEEAWRGQGVRR